MQNESSPASTNNVDFPSWISFERPPFSFKTSSSRALSETGLLFDEGLGKDVDVTGPRSSLKVLYGDILDLGSLLDSIAYVHLLAGTAALPFPARSGPFSKVGVSFAKWKELSKLGFFVATCIRYYRSLWSKRGWKMVRLFPLVNLISSSSWVMWRRFSRKQKAWKATCNIPCTFQTFLICAIASKIVP